MDADIVAEQLPRGNPSVAVVRGGLNVDDSAAGEATVIAAAAVEAVVQLDEGAWKISGNCED